MQRLTFVLLALTFASLATMSTSHADRSSDISAQKGKGISCLDHCIMRTGGGKRVTSCTARCEAKRSGGGGGRGKR